MTDAANRAAERTGDRVPEIRARLRALEVRRDVVELAAACGDQSACDALAVDLPECWRDTRGGWRRRECKQWGAVSTRRHGVWLLAGVLPELEELRRAERSFLAAAAAWASYPMRSRSPYRADAYQVAWGIGNRLKRVNSPGEFWSLRWVFEAFSRRYESGFHVGCAVYELTSRHGLDRVRAALIERAWGWQEVAP